MLVKFPADVRAYVVATTAAVLMLLVPIHELLGLAGGPPVSMPELNRVGCISPS